ncbi:MAG: hypothetical protein CO093_06545 [Alphaproteobacteria bacterium CG_4_9_14_3_um_filter_47_13]|nr:MAG: hypothetical protein CO093_06545 [Alphaproteobacteria bacterium CG_4_9_14_3_um_filter_47_13]
MSSSALTKIFMAATLGLALAGTALASESPDPTEHQKTVQQICNSPAPFLQLDHFYLKKPDYGIQALDAAVDIDGDLIPDIGHGDMVEKIASFSGKKVITYGISQSHLDMTANMIADQFFDIAQKIENGEIEKPAAIIFSISFPFSFKAIYQLLGTDLHLTPENILDKQNEIIEKIIETHEKNPNQYTQMVSKIHKAITILKAMKVPVITGAGNDSSPNHVNMAALLGAIPVGALSHDGKKKLSISNINNLTSVYKVGEVFSRRVANDDIDINNDEKADFPSRILSNKRMIIDIFYNNQTTFPLNQGTSLAAPAICNR